MKIVFLGTPAFAIPTLEVLIHAGHDIVGVVTATDKMGGRGGKQVIQSAIKKYAVSKNLKILQPKNLKSPIFQEELRSLGAEIQVVVAFRMLPVAVWDMPVYGTINLHGSLLPRYRGAAPINWAIINGDKKTGVTSFKLQHEIDTGDVILNGELDIKEADNVGTIHDRMMHLGAQVMAKTIAMIEKDEVTYIQQDESLVSKAPKIFTEDCKIDFGQTVNQIYNFVRGLSPYPTAWTLFDEKILKIYNTEKQPCDHNETIGKWSTDKKTYFRFAAKDGYIRITELQLQGKRRMSIKDFLNGFKFQN